LKPTYIPLFSGYLFRIACTIHAGIHTRFPIKLSINDTINKLWIDPESESYYALKKIIMAKDFLKDLTHATHFVHTGRLESYHNLRLKYMPKRIHLKYKGM